MITAADLMTRNVISVKADMLVPDVAKIILERRISALPVVDDDDHLLGIVSEGDLVRSAETGQEAHRSSWLSLLTATNEKPGGLFGNKHRTVGEVMSRNVLLSSEHENLQRLIELLAVSRIKRLPIVRQKKLVGIVSRVDVLQYLAGTFSRTGRLVA